MSFDPQTYLQEKNPHPRDKRISFYEPTHTYTITLPQQDGSVKYDDGFTSVTTWVHSHFSHFDADAVIRNMMRSKKWTKSKYYGMTADEIKKMWEDNGKEASSAGSKIHYDIECFYNNVDVSNDSVEYQYFKQFEECRTREDGGFGNTLMPYRTEWTVFDEELRLSGSIDMIYEDEDGSLQIYDWKRCKDIKKTDGYGKCSHTECINHLQDTNYWHYSLQLNTYKMILERNYGKKVTGLYLVRLHPNNKFKTFERIKVPFLTQEIADLVEMRKNQVKEMI